LRRRAKASAIVRDQPSPERSAPSAACWLGAEALLVRCPLSLPTASTIGGGPVRKPMRQPVIAWLLLTPFTTTVRPARPGIAAGETCRPS
jgi:hypothetical protein